MSAGVQIVLIICVTIVICLGLLVYFGTKKERGKICERKKT